MSELATQAPFLVAGRAPEAVIAPANLDELREVVASRDGRTLVPAGGRTQLALGSAPRGPSRCSMFGWRWQGRSNTSPRT